MRSVVKVIGNNPTANFDPPISCEIFARLRPITTLFFALDVA